VNVVGPTPRRNYDVLRGYIIGNMEQAEETQKSQETQWKTRKVCFVWPAQDYSFIEPHFSSS
jgi:hypothetical protein